MKSSTISRMRTALMAGCAAVAFAPALAQAQAQTQNQAIVAFDIPAQDLDGALTRFGQQSEREIIISAELTRNRRAKAVQGNLRPEEALGILLADSGLTYRISNSGSIIVEASDPQGGSAAGAGAEVEALIVTAQKREEDIQDVPIAISAFTQEDLTRSQIAGGPDLMTQVPNFTFTKTNFTGYSIQIRGIGTQAISATTDAAVAVAFNNTPFIRNRFFEQEFYDLQRVEVLRGPQGTLYGRNATAGVVNLISAKPKFNFEAKASADLSNYGSHRLEGMVNIPIVEDKVALRLAGAWTKRDGYVTNQITGNPIDGRDLWSTRLSLRVSPNEAIDANLIWEHFEENDDRLRSGKQLCKRDDRTEVGGYRLPGLSIYYSDVFNQGCLAESLYSPRSFEAPSGYSLPYYHPLGQIFLPVVKGYDPYASTTQSTDLRVIESTVDPEYRARTDLVEFQVNIDLTDRLTLASETSYLVDDLFSMEDYNRFNTVEGAFDQAWWDDLDGPGFESIYRENLLNDGVFCDPQIGCTSRVVAVDSSTAKSTQFSQEFRLSSDYDGAFNFSLGANFLRYDTIDKYYVFINTLSLFAAISPYGRNTRLPAYEPGVSDNSECLRGLSAPEFTVVQDVGYCTYIDPNPIGSLNDMGHNYFLSKNPYKLISYAVFGESYYQVTDTLKLTAGLRWTVDKKEAPRIPSWILAADSAGYPVYEIIEQEWREPTGRLTLDWQPDLSFTDETLLYASYAHGYKAGGSNPPPTGIVMYCSGCGVNAGASQGAIRESAAKPKTFDPEFVNAFELGAKNTLLDGRLTLNTAAFYYDYQGYQISQIMDRSAVNYNFDAKVWGLEIEADWRPLENLRLGFKGGYENTRIADGMKALDIMDRTAGNDDWVVVRPFPTFASNCILPTYVLDGDADGVLGTGPNQFYNGNPGPCEFAYILDLDPATGLPYKADPTETNAYGQIPPGYPGFNPLTAPNHGAGFDKELGGNELPNAPHFTATITADYTVPMPSDWLMTLHTDLYYQSEAWTRVFNTPGYDKLKAYNNVNLAAIFTNEEGGWHVMAYIKNVLDKDNITGAFLNSDDTGLTTNVFLNEPRLYGLRVTKEWTGGAWWNVGPGHPTGEPYPLTVELGGQVQRHDAPYRNLTPSFASAFSAEVDPRAAQNRDLDWGDGRDVKVTWRPSAGVWSLSAGVRHGRANGGATVHQEQAGEVACGLPMPDGAAFCDPSSETYEPTALKYPTNTSDASAWNREAHTIVDFALGRDMGLGQSGAGASSLHFGLRHANLESRTETSLFGIPDWELVDGWAQLPATHHRYEADLSASREFEGTGPVVSWDASAPLFDDGEIGRVNVDWSVGGGVLFGKQTVSIDGFEQAGHYEGKYILFPQALTEPITVTPVNIHRSESVTVPVVDLSLGLSYEVSRFKVGAGYRWERYFDVLDAGYAKAAQYDRTIDGPYFRLSVGFGG